MSDLIETIRRRILDAEPAPCTTRQAEALVMALEQVWPNLAEVADSWVHRFRGMDFGRAAEAAAYVIDAGGVAPVWSAVSQRYMEIGDRANQQALRDARYEDGTP